MTRIDYRLILALTLSLILHLAPLLNEIAAPAPPPAKAGPIEAQLRPAPKQAPLMMPEQPAVHESAPHQKSVIPKKAPKPQITQQHPLPTRVKSWQDEVKRQIKKLDERGLFYPADAIARGLEGEALVLLIIDENGKVSAARLEQGSGHRILDEAALRAVRSLHSLPTDAPHETLLPVRFRLN